MRLKEISNEFWPREKLKIKGVDSLNDAELLALILRTGTFSENAIDFSRRILGKHPLSSLKRMSLSELMQEKGIGKAKACQIIAVFELAKRVKISESKKITSIKSPEDVFRIFSPLSSDLDQENVFAIFLNTKNAIISYRRIFIGEVNISLIHPREIFREAIRELSVSLIIVHNHPSGDPTPSDEDITVTKTIKETGKIIGIKLLDHIIIGKNKFYSFSSEGLL